jgi:hypothetical protein
MIRNVVHRDDAPRTRTGLDQELAIECTDGRRRAREDREGRPVTQRPTKTWPVALAALVLLLAGCGEKKRPVSRQDFETVTDYVDKNMRSPAVSPEDRRKYTVTQLGPPHRVDGNTQYWYTTAASCYYLQLGEEGWASWGAGVTADCKKWGVKP